MIYILKNKNAITAIISILLLMAVIVATLFVFRGWFYNYTQSTINDVSELTMQESGKSIVIDDLIGPFLYIINNVNDDIDVNSLTIDENLCNITILSYGINEINISNCLDDVGVVLDVMLVTKYGVVQRYFVN